MRISTIVLLCLSPVLAAEGDEQFDVDAAAHVIFTTIMSPYCPGLLLGSCPSGQAVALRDSIRTQLAKGRPSQEIIDELVAIHGEEILGMPPYSGTGVLVWTAPAVALLFGLVVVVRRARSRSLQVSPPTPSQESDLKKRLEQELAEFD